MKTKRCQACRNPFVPARSMQVVCGFDCSMALAKTKREKAEAQAKKAERAQDKVRREKLKTIPKLIAEAQEVFNRWIRSRDEKQPCISCGAPPPVETYQGGRDAGHFRSTGAASHLRYHEDNCHAQCVHCNQYLSGNVSAYRSRLVERIGVDRVEALEQMNDAHKWQRDELIDIKARYSAKLKASRSMGSE